MALGFEKIRKNIQKTAENVRQSVADAAEKLPESVKDIRVSDTVKDLSQKGQSAFSTLKAKSGEAIAEQKEKKARHKEAVSEALQQIGEQEMTISISDALRLIYCLMIADGTVSDEEKEKFYEIGQELDPEFSSYQAELVEEGSHLMSMAAEDEDDYYDNIHDHVSTIIHSPVKRGENGIRGKILMWDLLTVAYSEGDYSSNEKRLLRFIAKGVGVDYAELLEMEHTVRTLLAVETEERWLKNSNRPYAVVEERVNELTDRKDTIMLGIREMLAD